MPPVQDFGTEDWHQDGSMAKIVRVTKTVRVTKIVRVAIVEN